MQTREYSAEMQSSFIIFAIHYNFRMNNKDELSDGNIKCLHTDKWNETYQFM